MNDPTMTFEEAHDYLDEVAEKLPPAIFEQLNGGIVLQPELVRSPHGPGLFTMGMYHNDPYGLGRYIAIYYGSFVRVHGRAPRQQQEKALREVLHHELTHHIESLAGVRDLEVEDELFLEQYAAAQQQRVKPRRRKKDEEK